MYSRFSFYTTNLHLLPEKLAFYGLPLFYKFLYNLQDIYVLRHNKVFQVFQVGLLSKEVQKCKVETAAYEWMEQLVTERSLMKKRKIVNIKCMMHSRWNPLPSVWTNPPDDWVSLTHTCAGSVLELVITDQFLTRHRAAGTIPQRTDNIINISKTLCGKKKKIGEDVK